MSAANSSAKKRRAPPEVIQSVGRPNANANTNTNTNATGLTLPQVIAVIDKRLVNLETFMVESKSSGIGALSSGSGISSSSGSGNNIKFVRESTLTEEDRDEYESRFNILAHEMAMLKNTIMNLQSYTMSVTKTFMEEKTGTILSDIVNIETSESSIMDETFSMSANI